MQKRTIYPPNQSCLFTILATGILWLIFWCLSGYSALLGLMFLLMIGVAPVIAFLFSHKWLTRFLVWRRPVVEKVPFTHTYEEQPGEPTPVHVHSLNFCLATREVTLEITEKDYAAIVSKGSSLLTVYYNTKYPSLFYVSVE